MDDTEFSLETLCLHAGQVPDRETGARATPLYQTSSYVFDDADHAAALFNLQTFGNVYTRLSNPTTAVLEQRVAALEGGRAALATASGMAAQTVALLTLCRAGDHIVAAGGLYGGSVSQLAVTFERFGIAVTFVDAQNPQAFATAIQDNTRCLFAESLGNPSMVVLDIEAVAEVAHKAGLPLVVDNTVPSPYLCRPIEHGADVVVHSATKYLGGHGTSLGGVVVESGQFNWDNGKFPEMVEPSTGYHGVKFYETFGDFAFTMKCRYETMRTLGPTLSPFNAWQILQGIETLHLRMPRHCENALTVAQFLKQHPQVSWVNYPGLDDDKAFELAQKYMPDGQSSLLAFGLKGGREDGAKFIDGLQFLSHLANIGDARSLVIHPASTTHRQLDDEQLEAAGVSPDAVRLSVGLEGAADIIRDIDTALATL
ncbi:MAG: O-acetylhomoserine aminocarboxypropyltransferase/cysteine synthase family protein [Granulosicoccaceae bacterium]